MHQNILNETKPEFEKTLQFLKEELARLRTGRASPALVEDLKVECYGGVYRLKEVAAISVPDAKSIVIQPWDKAITQDVMRAITSANIGLNPVPDQDIIRLHLPSLTEDYRKELLKFSVQKMEEARQVMRRFREEAWTKVQALAKDGKIREDDKFRAKDELQKLVDEYNGKIEEIGKKKEEEIMTS